MSEPRAACAACAAEQPYGRIVCTECGQPLVFPVRDPYRDQRFVERACDRCGKAYQGPAVYCSFECAVADA
jgi:predicted amidophosphoribosyltransferase